MKAQIHEKFMVLSEYRDEFIGINGILDAMATEINNKAAAPHSVSILITEERITLSIGYNEGTEHHRIKFSTDILSGQMDASLNRQAAKTGNVICHALFALESKRYVVFMVRAE